MCPNADVSYYLSFSEIIQAPLTLQVYIAVNERETASQCVCAESRIAWQARQIHDSGCSACADSGQHPDADALAPDSLPTE